MTPEDFASAVSILLVLIAGGWTITGLKIHEAIAPLELAIERNHATLAERGRILDQPAK